MLLLEIFLCKSRVKALATLYSSHPLFDEDIISVRMDGRRKKYIGSLLKAIEVNHPKIMRLTINNFARSQTAKDVSTEVIQHIKAKPILVHHHP
jgi:hypothetical protein